MSEEVITCSDCGRVFIWTLAEQHFYRERGLSAPKRCPECRSRRRYEQASGDGAPRTQTLRDTPQPAAPGARPAPQPFTPPPQRAEHRGERAAGTSPFARFGLITFGLAILVALIMRWAAPALDVVFCWLFAITVVAFFAYGYDKLVAGSEQTRVPEIILLALTLAGGTLGALSAMRYFHHKTAKAEFQGKLWLILAVQIVLFIVWFLRLRPQ